MDPHWQALNCFLLFACLFSLVQSPALAYAAGKPIPFIWPLRYTAVVEELVIDASTGPNGIQGVGLIYTDYSLPAQRTDELWNASTLLNTSFGNLGLRSDQHLSFAEKQYFSYFNASGGFCSALPLGIFNRTAFTEDTFVGEVTYNNISAFRWNATFSVFGMDVVYELIADQTSLLPLFQQMRGPPNSVLEYNSARYVEFTEVSSPFDKTIFAIPPFC